MNLLFCSDLHGKEDKYNKLIHEIKMLKPDVVLLGGDLLPHYYAGKNFVMDFIIPKFSALKNELEESYPEIFIILGNDDAKTEEENILKADHLGLVQYIHMNKRIIGEYSFYGYSIIPPSPFLLKDWEKYDVSRYTDPGAISPENGKRTIEIPLTEIKHSSIKNDLEKFVSEKDLSKSIFLFHSPPHNTNLDKAALEGKMIDHIPLDPHVGSIAIKRFIEEKQPLLTLHGHIHESTKLTGSWQDKIGKTFCFNAAHDGSELSIIKIDLNDIANSKRILV